MDNKVFISGFFSESDQAVLDKYCTELEEKNIILQVRNLSGTFMNSALDFTSVEVVMFSYELIKSFVSSGAYDIFKHYILNLWKITRKNETSQVPFTMTITGIPTIYGPENIECKISEPLTSEEKEIAIGKQYELAKQIENHQFELLKRSQYYDAFGAHVFRYDSQSCSFAEINIAEEIRKKIDEGKDKTDN